MAIVYQTAKFKSAKIAIWDPTAKFNYRQYFRLYSMKEIKIPSHHLPTL